MSTSTTLRAVCPSCLAANRFPAERAADRPLCGRCKARLLPPSPIELDAARLARFVSGSDLPLLVDFWAPWCGPCRTMAPAFAEAAQELAGRALLAKLDTEAHQEPASRLRIESIPTLVLFEHGAERARHVGAVDARAVVDWLAAQEG